MYITSTFVSNCIAGKRNKPEAGGAGLWTMLLFSVIFLSFTTLFLVKYKKGQLGKMASNLSPEVQQFAKKVFFL